MGLISDGKKTNRLFFIDNLRLLLIFLVVAFHSGQPYGPPNGWLFESLKSTPDFFTYAVLGMFYLVTSAFFMGFFFLISGYFTPYSYNRKGAIVFLKDRFLRLGIPLIVIFLLVMPLLKYIKYYLLGYGQLSYFEYFIFEYQFEFYHLWFLAHLLVYDIFYTLWCQISKCHVEVNPREKKVPGNLSILLFVIGLAIVTFIVRIWYPIGMWDFLRGVEFARLPQYISLFILGIIANSRGWFLNLDKSTGKTWLMIGFAAIALLPIIFVLFGWSDPNLLYGGLHWQSFIYATWESFVCAGMCVGLLVLFREKFNFESKLGMMLSANVYTVYIIHIWVGNFLHTLLKNINLYPFIKFVLVTLAGVPLCFLISHYIIRRFPLAKKVL